MKLCVCIPAYNEEKTISIVIDEIKKTLKGYNYEIVVVDDGSTDKTSEISKSRGAEVVRLPYNYGLSEAYRTECQEAIKRKADVIIIIDADNQYRASEIPKLAKPVIGNEADLVLGSRFKGHIESMPLIKRLGNMAFTRVISNITRVKFSDCQTGFRAFNQKVAKLDIISDHTYTQETIIRAVRNKLRIKEVPVYFGRRHDESRLLKNPFEYAVKAWINILRIYRDFEPLRFFGYIGVLFFAAGSLIGLWFIYLHFTTGIKGHQGLMILMLLLMISSIQIVLFGFLADLVKR